MHSGGPGSGDALGGGPSGTLCSDTVGILGGSALCGLIGGALLMISPGISFIFPVSLGGLDPGPDVACGPGGPGGPGGSVSVLGSGPGDILGAGPDGIWGVGPGGVPGVGPYGTQCGGPGDLDGIISGGVLGSGLCILGGA